MACGRFVAYYRVSTERQGKSGLGLEAQRKAVSDYLNGGAWSVLAEFQDIESGKHNDRPGLQAALAACRLRKAKLVIAKIDRLSRDAAFLLSLRDADVDFVAADMPAANRLTIGILAVVAEAERDMISARTKAALAAARDRGVKLGGWRGGPTVDHKLAAEARTAASDAFARMVGPMIADMRQDGLSLRQIAARLTQDGVATQRGGVWTAAGVRNITARN